MVRCDRNTSTFNVHRCVTGVLNPVIFSAIFVASPLLEAEQNPEIAKYTLQREKTSEFVSSTLQSGKRPEIEIIERSGSYQINVNALIAAPASYVREVLTDYMHIYRLNPSIIESDILKRHDDGSVSVRTKVIGCAAYFCEELERVEKVSLLPSGDLRAEIIPELSQFKSGDTLWRIKSVGDNCEVIYQSNVEPDIYIPPVVGKFLIKKSLREEMQISFENLEKIARVLSNRQWQEDYQLANDQDAVDVTPPRNTNRSLSDMSAMGE